MSQIKLRQGTAAAWTSANPVLAMGEEGFETDTKKKKTGDGTTAWASLAYNSASTGGGLLAANNLSDVASAATSRTNLGAAPAASPTFTGTVTLPTGLTGLAKLTAGVVSAGASGTDYAPATSGTTSLKGNGSGGFSAATLNDNGAPTADYSMNSHKITNQADPTAAQDSATKNYVDTRQFTANMGATTASVTNTTTDTTLWTPANVAATSLVGGTTCFRIRFGGNFDNAATSGAFTARIKINGTTVASVPVAISQTGAATLTAWWADVDVYIDVTGSTGSVTAQGYGVEITAAGGARNTIPVLATTTLLNMTAGVQFTLTGQMGTANASNVLRIWRAVINQIA